MDHRPGPSARPVRRLGALAAIAAALAVAASSPARADPAAARGRHYGEPSAKPPEFRAALAPLGEWVRLSGGVRAWRPDGVGAAWQPYRDGQWARTDEGWYWVSAEPWAWATYHYGRWRFDASYGWLWLPGAEWAPARVVWRYGPGVVGWAPETDDQLVLPAHWTFLSASRFAEAPVAEAALPAARVPELLLRSRVAGESAPVPTTRTAVAPPPSVGGLASAAAAAPRVAARTPVAAREPGLGAALEPPAAPHVGAPVASN